MDTDSSAFLDLESKQNCCMTSKGVSGTVVFSELSNLLIVLFPFGFAGAKRLLKVMG